MRSRDLTGQKYHWLKIISKAPSRFFGSRKRPAWVAECICGNKVEVSAEVKRGSPTSCGCKTSELRSLSNRTHGHKSNGKVSPEFMAWQSMLKRCYNPASRGYENYGGRGIRVCRRWRKDFSIFLSDIGYRPSSNHSLERRDNSKGYFPENVCWATRAEQSRNQRRNHWITFRGKRMVMSDWAKETGISLQTLSSRLGKLSWSVKRALTVAPSEGKK